MIGRWWRSTYIHSSDELPWLHTVEIAIDAATQTLFISRDGLVDLPHRLAQSCRAQEAAGKTGYVSTQAELAIFWIGAHEVEILFDVETKEFQHVLWTRKVRQRVHTAGKAVVGDSAFGLEDQWISLGKIIDHDFDIELLDRGINQGSGADCEFWFGGNERSALSNAFEISRVDSDPFAACTLLDT